MIYKKHTKRCVVCGEIFIAHKSNAKTCSGRCRTALNRKNKRGNIIGVSSNTIDGTYMKSYGNRVSNNTIGVTNAAGNTIDVTEKGNNLLEEYLQRQEVFRWLIDIHSRKTAYNESFSPKLISIDEKKYHYIGNVFERKLGYISDVSFEIVDKIACAETSSGFFDIYISTAGKEQIEIKYPDFYAKINFSNMHN